MTKTLCCIQARLASRRFPRKALADLLGKPVVAWVVEAVRQVKGLDRVVLVCPLSDAEAFTALQMPCEVVPAQTIPARVAPDGTVLAWDLLAAFASVAADLPDDARVMRVTGDCPLWLPAVGTAVLARARDVALQPDASGRLPRWWFVTADTNVSGFYDGTDAEVFPAALLRDAQQSARWPLDREHVSRWMRRYAPVTVVSAPEDRGTLVLSVNTPSDLTRVREYLRAEHLRADGSVSDIKGG